MVMAAPKIAAPLKPVRRKDHPQYADPADLLQDSFLEPQPSPIFPLRPPVDHAQPNSWEVRAFEEEFQSASGGVWPPRSYWCGFCRREFRSAQALGGHMNVHRRDRARLRLLPQAGAPSEPLYPTGNTDQATAPSTPLGLLNPILPTSLSHNNHSSNYYPVNPYLPPPPLQVMQKRLPDRGSWYNPIDAESHLQIGGSSPNYQTLCLCKEPQYGTEEADVRSVDLELRLGQTN